MKKSFKTFVLNKESWLQEGLILQLNKNQFVLGTPPFSFSKKPQRGFYCPGFFFQNQNPWIKPHKLFVLRKEDLTSLIATEKKTRNPSGTKEKREVLPSFVEFSRIFFQIQQKIKRGELEKAVPVFFEKIKGSLNILPLLKNIFQSESFLKNEGFFYGFWNNSSRFMGFTPEFLFSMENPCLKVMALAGSAPHPGPDLFLDPKELQEHHLVVKSLREGLQDFFIEKKTSFKEKPFGNLKHLCTLLEGKLQKELGFEGLCQKLHPTPALGGYPKEKALEFLKQDPYQKKRRFFASPFGFFDGNKKGFCVIAIRGIQWDSSGTFIGSGCGIINKSILQKEWRELSLKRGVIKKLFFP